MFTIKIAGLNISIDNKYPGVERLCRDYIVDVPQSECDMSVAVSEDDVSREVTTASEPVSRSYAESLCIYRAICSRLPEFEAFLLHAAVVEVDGVAYAFTAKSGTGKTTHITLWKKLLGDRVKIINGDKPIIRFHDGTPYAYGTPWCGKEGYNVNTRAPLSALCFVERAEENRIAPFGGQQMLGRLMGQILIPRSADEIIRLTSLLDRLVRTVPCYLLGCNMDIEAARVAYDGMRQGGAQ